MYLDYYHLTEDPFSATASDRYFYRASPHAQVITLLQEAVRNHSRVLLLTGPEAVGKTSLLPPLCKQLVERNEVDRIYCQALRTGAKGTAPCREYRTGATATSFSELIRCLTDDPGENTARSTTSMLILDNAQHLHNKHLHDIRSIMRFEARRGRVLKMLLLGPPHLSTKLGDFKMGSTQKSVINICLNKMSEEETRYYIDHRLSIAGAERLFTREAVERLHQFSGGIPGRINKLCQMSLRHGCNRGVPLIDVNIAESAGIEYIQHTLEGKTEGGESGAEDIHPICDRTELPEALDGPFLSSKQPTLETRNDSTAGVERKSTPVATAGPAQIPELPSDMILEIQMIVDRLGGRQPRSRVIGFTSAVAGEGTSTVASLVAAATAARPAGRTKVGDHAHGFVLVDGQMTSPNLHSLFSLSLQPGLHQVLADRASWENAIHATSQPALKVIPAGRNGEQGVVPWDPGSLDLILRDLRARFDQIFIDIPPVLCSLNALKICQLCDSVVLIVRAGGARWQIAYHAARVLQERGVNLLGCILNQRKFLIPETIYRRL